jgi:DNA-directed RNA polymerase subunit RPC12/RpoP
VLAPISAPRTLRRYPVVHTPAMSAPAADRHTSRLYRIPDPVANPAEEPNTRSASLKRPRARPAMRRGTTAHPTAQPGAPSRPRLCKSDAYQSPPFTPVPVCKSVAQRICARRTVFCIFDARMVRCRRMLPRPGATPHLSARLITPGGPRLSPIKPPDRCPHCNSKRLIKKGTRKKKQEDVRLYRCRACGRTFAPGPRAIRNKTYPLPEILEGLHALRPRQHA